MFLVSLVACRSLVRAGRGRFLAGLYLIFKQVPPLWKRFVSPD